MFGQKILAGAVRIHDGLDQILRHLIVISQQLFRVLGQAIASISKGRIVVMRANTWIETDTFDDLACVHVSCQSIAVQLVKECNPHGQIGIGEQFGRFGLSRIGIKNWHIGFV